LKDPESKRCIFSFISNLGPGEGGQTRRKSTIRVKCLPTSIEKSFPVGG